MKAVKIYTTTICPYCDRAKDLFRRKKVPYEEIDVTGDDAMRERLVEMSGGRKTVPQIWIGDRHVGGFDDLSALDRSGELDALLK
jgi:glutaredoxin 3